MKTAIVALMCCALVGATASVAHADPLVVTSGSLGYDSDFGCCGAHLDLVAGPVSIAVFVGTDPIPGAAGAFLSAGASVPFNVRVKSFGQAFSGDQAEGELQLIAAPIVLPSNPASMPRFEFVTPFTMTGNLNARTLSGAPVFNGPIVGSGSLNVFLRPVGNTALFLDDAIFTFAAPAAATPEPTTVLLMCGGLAVLLVRKRVRV